MNDLLYAFLGLDGQHVRANLAASSAAGGAAAGAAVGGGAALTPLTPSSQVPSTANTAVQGPALHFQVTTQLQPTAYELVQRVLPIW
jgi:hypothetical protein